MLGKFIILLLMLGMFSFLFIALNSGYTQVYSWAGTQITDAGSVQTMSILNIMWTWWPVGVLFSFLVWLISRAAMEKEVWG